MFEKVPVDVSITDQMFVKDNHEIFTDKVSCIKKCITNAVCSGFSIRTEAGGMDECVHSVFSWSLPGENWEIYKKTGLTIFFFL